MDEISISSNKGTIQITHLAYLAWIELHSDHTIRFCYHIGEMYFNFGLYSEVGEPLMPIFKEMLKKYKVKLNIIDTESNYSNGWTSYTYNKKTYKESK